MPGLEQGRVFSRREALQLKLIDQIGGEDEVRRWLEETRGVPKNLRIVDWKPKRDNDWGVLGMMTGALATLLGLEPIATRLFTEDARLQTLLLDGMVSVWQPAEK